MVTPYRSRLAQLGIDAGELTLDHKGTLTIAPAPAAATSDDLPRLSVSEAPAEAADLRRGDVLGRGGMGIVTSATQRALRRPVAIKEVIEARHEAQLLREAMITGALEHPNIVPVHMLGRGPDGQPVIVMKRIDGTPWSQSIRPLFSADAQVDLEELERHLGILLQVCNAIDFAHSRGVVHRDLKPDNVMVGEFGEVYVVDWGIAHVVGDALGDVPPLDRASKLVGTPGYMAPEMAAGDTDHVSPRTDVYLLGAILHELIVGETRHTGDTIFAKLAAAYESVPYRYPKWIPEELASLCNAATEADPERRLPDVGSFRQAVRDFLSHRSSRELADGASRRLDSLEALLGEDLRGQTFDAVEIHTLASEARFGFEQALAQWSHNDDARIQLQRLLELMIDYELRNNNVRAAAGLLADLPERQPELEARLREAVVKATARKEEIAELERLREAGDLAVSAPVRMRMSVWYGSLLAIVVLGLTALRYLKLHEPGYPDALAVMMLAGVSLYLSRNVWEQGNLVNRRIIDGITATTGLLAMSFVLCWIGEVPFASGLAVAMLVAATMAAALSVFVERGLAVTAIGFLATAALIVLLPDWRGVILALGCFASFLASALVWRRMMYTEGPRPARSMRATGAAPTSSDPRLSRHSRANRQTGPT